MLAAMIGSNSRVAVGPETQFFCKLSPQRLAAAAEDPNWPELAVEALMGLTLAEQSVVKLFGLDRGRLKEILQTRTPSIKAMLEALTGSYSKARNKRGWAEKTPNHLLNLPLIRSVWPTARILRIIRDPRDSALSTCRLPTFSNSFLANLYLWRTWQDTANPFFESDKLSMTLRYEDLVLNAEGVLRSICEFTGHSFEPAMLDFRKAASDVSSLGETWKRPVSGGLTKDRLYVWKRELSPDLGQVANDVVFEYLERYDYERSIPSNAVRHVFRLSPAFVEEHEAILRGLHKNDERWLPTENVFQADSIFEHPKYKNFRNPIQLARKWHNLRKLHQIGRPSV